MAATSGDNEDFAGTDDVLDSFIPEEPSRSPGDDKRDLFAWVAVRLHEAASVHANFCDHGLIALNAATKEQLDRPVFGDGVPAVNLCSHAASLPWTSETGRLSLGQPSSCSHPALR